MLCKPVNMTAGKNDTTYNMMLNYSHPCAFLSSAVRL